MPRGGHMVSSAVNGLKIDIQKHSLLNYKIQRLNDLIIW